MVFSAWRFLFVMQFFRFFLGQFVIRLWIVFSVSWGLKWVAVGAVYLLFCDSTVVGVLFSIFLILLGVVVLS